MKIKTFEFTIKKKCSRPFHVCSDEIIDKLKPLGLKLRVDKEDDIVNGFLSMVHASNNHSITVAVYQENENPITDSTSTSFHLATFKKPTKIPTKKEIEDLIK